MLTAAILVLTHLAAGAAGAFAWPHIETLFSGVAKTRNLSKAKALIAKVEADAKALADAKATVAAAPVSVPSGPTGH